jgi:cardiolipin synthase A/B
MRGGGGGRGGPRVHERGVLVQRSAQNAIAYHVSMSPLYGLYLASRWIIRIVMLFYVPQRRSPNAARAWLLLIFVEPYAGLLIYSMFGRPYLPRQRLQRQKEASRLVRETPAVRRTPALSGLLAALQPAARLAQKLGDFPVVAGNHVELLPDYADAIDRLVRDIDDARASVHLLYYIVEPDETGWRVGQAVMRASRRGVACRVLMDGVASKPGLREMAPRLREAGAEVSALLPPGLHGARRDLRSHRKIAILDGRVGYAGSQNLVNAYGYKGRGLTYEELALRIEGPAVSQLQAIFLTDHFLETGKRLELAPLFPDSQVVGSVCAQLLPSGPTYRTENIQRVLIQLLYQARERVVVTSPYFVPDSAFVEAMEAAAQRGVAVHLVTPKQVDQSLVRLAQESFYSALLDAGVRIHLYRPRFLHAKHFSVDSDVAVIGSSNMDLRSFELNEEAMVICYDQHVTGQLAAIQERYVRDSDELTAEAWQTRSRLRGTAQQLARLVDSLL